MKLVLFSLMTLMSFPTFALSKVAKLDCSSPSASINVLEEFGGGGYKVVIGKVSVGDQSRSGFDVLVPNQKTEPATLLTAALPGYTFALKLPARTDLMFPPNGSSSMIAAEVMINGVAEAAVCTVTQPAVR